MNRTQKKLLKQQQTTRQLMGIRRVNTHGVTVSGGELVFFRNGGAGEPVREFRVPAVPRG